MYRHIFNCTTLLHRRVADPEPSSAFRRPADILKGDENVLIRMQRKRIDNLFCCVGLAWNLFVVSLFFPSIKESKGVEYACSHCKSVSLLADCGCFRSVCEAGVEEPLSGLPCPEFKRIVDINHKLTNWMNIVKKKICGAKK